MIARPNYRLETLVIEPGNYCVTATLLFGELLANTRIGSITIEYEVKRPMFDVIFKNTVLEEAARRIHEEAGNNAFEDDYSYGRYHPIFFKFNRVTEPPPCTT